jgi:hypothetical protein
MIHGIAELSVDFQYDHTKSLSPQQRMQYLYWTSYGCDPFELWFLKVDRSFALPQALDASQYLTRRLSRLYTTATPEQIHELLQDGDVDVDWAQDHNELCIAIPEPFAKLISHGWWQCLCIPSPYSTGWWKAPFWFRQLLSPELRNMFEATQEKGPCALSNQESFSLPMTGALAHMLRSIDLSGAANNHQTRDDLQCWISRLQVSSDICESSRKPDRTFKFEQIVRLMCLAEFFGMLVN